VDLNFTQSGFGASTWALDSVPGYGAKALAGVVEGFFGTFARVYVFSSLGFARFAAGDSGSIVDGNAAFGYTLRVGYIVHSGPDQSGYFGFRDTKGGRPLYGWAKWTTSATNTLTLNEWYYNATPGASITVGDRGSSTDIPFDFNPLEGAALGVPIFIGLRQLKRRKLKANSMVSVKGKEKIHPLALLGMGAAGVLKWRAQKDKDAA